MIRSDKADGALRTIGELSAETGIATHVLRYWERHVSAIAPLRRAGGRRYYRAEDVAIVRRLNRLINEEGYTLEGAARAVSRRGGLSEGMDAAVAVQVPTPAPAASLFARPAAPATDIGALVAIRDRLAHALAAA